MHVVVVFVNIGFYHAARLQAASDACSRLGWRFTAVQLTDDTLAHPWGDAARKINFPLETLLRAEKRATDSIGLPQLADDVVEHCLSKLRPDVVFLPGWSFRLSVNALRWCHREHVPAVVMSESKRDDEKRVWWKEWLKSWLYVREFSGALVGSDLHAEYVTSLGIPRSRVFKGYDAVDNAHFRRCADFARENEAAVRARDPRIPQRPYFLAVLRLMPRKNILGLLEAYARYRNRITNAPWDLVVCGDGEQKKSLEEAVRRSGLEDSFHLPGFLAYDEVGHWYGLAGAFVHPALKEQWGLVVNEACAAGVPILCSRTVGARYDLVQEGENGFLFDPDNIDDITRCLIQMHLIAPDDRRRMGERSRRIVKAFSPEAFAAGVVSAARAVVKRTQYEGEGGNACSARPTH
jgi:1,2-diacylglycerol 3-alpha-glucosyltransferase